MQTSGVAPAILPVPVLAGGLAVAVMLYWLWRLRARHTFGGIAGIAASDVTALGSK